MNHASTAQSRTRTPPPLAIALIVASGFAIGLFIGAGGLERLGVIARAAFQAIAHSHYVMYQARENLTADGQQEFAVLHTSDSASILHTFVAAQSGWSVRESLVPGWSVVSVPNDVLGALAMLRDARVGYTVLRNRGLWICH